ncbi:hypothetical protein KW845_09080 [Bordetella sp. BOR01]|nr:hypothetical protein [Bordetella sp. BOR01]MBV7483099.1 hypothetical protein [Bordetella sp. BOR01]
MILEHGPVAGIEIAFRGRPFGQHHAVLFQLDVVVLDFLDRSVLRDVDAIHQQFGRDQVAIDVQLVSGGYPQFTPGQVLFQGVLLHHHRIGLVTTVGRNVAKAQPRRKDKARRSFTTRSAE